LRGKRVVAVNIKERFKQRRGKKGYAKGERSGKGEEKRNSNRTHTFGMFCDESKECLPVKKGEGIRPIGTEGKERCQNVAHFRSLKKQGR